MPVINALAYFVAVVKMFNVEASD